MNLREAMGGGLLGARSHLLDNLMLMGAAAISLIVSLPRLAPGLPMGVDSSSHLSKVMFISDSLIRYGTIPFWNPDWYAGTPFLLLYPPLGYVLAGLLGVAIGPVLAYKLVDLTFYVVAPFTVYWLAKDLGFPRLESACAALLYSTVPQVVQNYVFFDRFPTTLAIVFFCLFVIWFRRTLRSLSIRRMIVPSTLLAAIVMTHHLSGFIAVLVALIYVIAAWPRRTNVIRHLLIGFGAIVGGLALSGFWLIPYAAALMELPPNPFFNRNVTFPFLSFTYFGVQVASAILGIAQFILAVVGFQMLGNRIYRPKLRFQPFELVLVLLAGMVPYELGQMSGSPALEQIGIAIIVLAFVVFLAEALGRCLRGRFERSTEHYRFLGLWFLFFLWAGLGYYAIPIVWFQPFKTIWVSLDVYRFWLYLAIPIVVLAAMGAVRAVRLALTKSKLLTILLLLLICVPVTLSPALRVSDSVNKPINDQLPFSTANSEIPSALIDYFDQENASGRILAIKCPLWIYLLPRYTDKATIDGWYPQSKLVRMLVEINDYRFDDLETTEPESERTAIWRRLIDNNELLGIEWLMVCELDPSETRIIVENSSFRRSLTIPYENTQISIYKAFPEVILISTSASGNFQIIMERPSPDHLRLRLNDVPSGTVIQIREAHFPTWAATANGVPVDVTGDEEGYITLKVDSWMTTVDIVQQPNRMIDKISWAVTLVTLVCLVSVSIMRPRNAAT